jgi:two-component system chemotaxis sensor kinase CheA
MVTLQGRLLPVFRMHRIFGVQGAVADPTEGLLLVVDGEGEEAAVLVDDLLGQQQVVVKSLSGTLGSVRGISGAAILGDGRVGLIVDATGLLEMARAGASGMDNRRAAPLARAR